MAINDSSKLWFFLRIGVLLLFWVAIFTWWVIKVVTWPVSNHTEHPHSKNNIVSSHKLSCLLKDPSISDSQCSISICSFRSIDENLLFKFVLYFWIFHPSFKGSDISGLWSSQTVIMLLRGCGRNTSAAYWLQPIHLHSLTDKVFSTPFESCKRR